MKSILRLLLCLLLITVSISVPKLTFAQCGLTGFTEPGVPANITPPCGTFAGVNVGPGTQTSFQVLNGASYSFSTCGSSFDTQITGRNSGNSQQFYNDDNGVHCTGNNASADWTATYTGTVFVVTTRYDCQLGGSSGGVSAILSYRQNNNLTITSSNAAMCPGATRTLTATPTGGTFSGTGVSGTTFTAPSSGPVTITYTFGACSRTQSITINSPNAAPTGVSANATSTCGGGVQLTAVGGSLGTNATYQWYAGGCGSGSVLGTGSILNVTPTATTTYYVRINGDCGATGCANTTITVNTPSTAPTGIGTNNNNFCAGGSATLTVQGGSLGTGATWRWYSGTCCSGPQIGTGNSITVTPPSTTTYFVRAEGGPCATTSSASITINISTPSTAPTGITSSNGTLFCNGLGTTTLTVQGGSLGAGATWQWYTGTCGGTSVGSGSSINVNPTSSTTYFVRAEGSCPPPTACAQLTINVSGGLSITSINKTDVTCNGANDGTATVNVTGGVGSYTYTWNPGTGGATRTGLAPGTYGVTVTDGVGCSTSSSVTINQPQVLNITNVTRTNVTCNGANDGTITITATGGTGTLQYSINNGGTFQTSNQFTGLGPASYTVVVIDANNCLATYNNNPVTILQPGGLTITITNQTDASCSGVNDGTITVQGAGGTGGFLYSLNGSPFQPGGLFANLSAGNYTVLVQDNSGCQATTTTSLANITTLVFTVNSVTNVSCAGQADGEFEVTASNGTAPYQYSINGITFQNSGTFTGLSGGTYTVLARDAAGCQVITQITVTEAAPLVLTVDSIQNLTCNGVSTGGAFITVTGGTPGNVPTYAALPGNVRSGNGLNDGTFSSISGGALTGRPAANGTCCSAQNPEIDIYEFTVSTTGTYTITNDYTVPVDGFMLLYTDPLDWTQNPPVTFVAGNDNCVNFLNSCVTVTLNAGQTYYLVTTRATGTGTALTWNTTFSGPGDVLEVTGFGGGYTYQWSNGAFTQDVTGLAAGTYTVTVTDDNGCSTSASVTITQPLPLTVSLANLAEVRCNGGTDGEIDITVTGGTPPFAFNWSNGNTTEDNTNLVAGTYDVTVTDANNCTATGSYTITEPAAIGITGVVTNAPCGTNPTGGVDITVTGGVAPYTYFWSNGQVTQDISNVGPGTYTVQVTDSRGCVANASFSVSPGGAISITIDAITNVTCNGGNNGSIETTVTGGTGPYTYTWATGQNTDDIFNLTAGTYSLTVTDNGGCQATITATVTEPAAIVTFATVTNVSCNGGNNGAIDVSVSGGILPYTYTWGHGPTTQDLTGLTAGTYSLTITDANGCTKTLSATVTQPAALVVQGNVTDVTCNGANNGSITLSVSGGFPAYTYQWSNGPTTASLFNLAGGNYTVTVTDANGCTASRSFTVAEPPVLVVTATGTNVSCNGGSDGSVSANASGGTPPYTYLWNNFNNNATQSNLSAGTYTVIVTDAKGCTKSASYTVTQPTAIVITETIVNVNCNGASTGSISVALTGGVGPYNVQWSNGSFTNGTTSSQITNLPAGNYNVTVTDQNGCFASESYTITQPTAIALSAVVTNAGCFGASTGSIDLSVAGGTGSYTYAWSPGGANSQDLNNVAAGIYTVTVTDGNGCTATGSYTITAPTAIQLQGTVVNATCNGVNDGDIYLTVTGGTGSYTYSWSNTATTQNLVNVAAGTYDVTVTDANGCTATGSYTITQPVVVTSTLTTVDVACFGGSTGSVDLTPAGGTAPYTYLWSNNFAASQDLTGVPAGTYVVVITDANGCQAMDTAVITENPALAISGTVTNVTCFGANNGSILVTVTGGVGPYTYAWSNGGSSDFEQNLVPGPYTVTATDAVGCTIEATYTITSPAQLTATGVVTNISCNSANDGSIDITVTGGTTPYNFLWSNNATTEDISGLAAATYDVLITDANGCTFRDTFDITEPDSLLSSITGTDATCNGSGDGSAILTVTGGTAPYTFFWSNFRFTQNIYNLTAGQYFVIITDAHGCQTVDSVTIGQPNPLTITGSAKGAGCGTEARGSVDVTVTGGTPPYNYLWNTGATTEDIIGLGSGTYSVTVTDDNGCQVFFTAIVNSFPVPTADFTASLACDDSEVVFTNASSISAGSLTYVWDFGDGSATTTNQDPIHIFTSPGTYPVRLIATSNEGCSDTLTQNVVVNPTPDATITANGSTGTVCAGDSVTLEAPTGTGYQYVWNTGDTTRTITVTRTGNYSVTITSGALCSGVGEIEVSIFSEASVTISPDTTVSLGFSTTLQATGGIAYEWSPTESLDNPFSATPVATPLVETTYTVTVTVATGCVTTREVTVSVIEDYRVDVPNLFTPNGDGINDYWVIKNIFTYNAEVFVFNRWGSEVFSTTNYQNDWNGTNMDGDQLADGTYYYVVKVGDKVYKGAITILR